MGIRSFLAFELAPDIKKQIETISKELRKSNLPVRWVKPENIHLTLIFLGDVEENLIEDIKAKVNEVVREMESFKIRLKGAGVFPGLKRPRVVWVGLGGDIDRLSDLRDNLQSKLNALGFIPERRPFKPHLTLGRFKGRTKGENGLKNILERYYETKSDISCLKEFILFKSDLKPNGAEYTKIFTWTLVP
ncbi:MAG: RNA 2',3'-cyclic phosphodiesterase [Thermodesulfobacteriota bacterium]|nr:RNA 2',3'-cyclic phosphodiesterase [Thermodesulfobacteriota bacterium]